MSYYAFPPSQPEDQADHVAAYKVSTARRAGKSAVLDVQRPSYSHKTVQVGITVLACWLASGIVFGFAAIKPVLISEGVYREFCTDEELRHDVEVCLEQDIREDSPPRT